MKSSTLKTFRAFTLIELLVVIAIIAVLAAIALPTYNRFLVKAAETKTLSNMRQMGGAMLLYAGDNNNQLPGRVQTAGVDKWPALLKPYVQNLDIYSSPIPDAGGKTYKVKDPTKYLDNTTNYTSYIYNGFNELGALATNGYAPRLSQIDRATSTILLGIPKPQSGHFYMDLSESDNTTVLNRSAFYDGSVYVFCDGSSRVLKPDAATPNNSEPTTAGSYSDWYWLVDKSRTDVIH